MVEETAISELLTALKTNTTLGTQFVYFCLAPNSIPYLKNMLIYMHTLGIDT